jgi:hypothetical protein
MIQNPRPEQPQIHSYTCGHRPVAVDAATRRSPSSDHRDPLIEKLRRDDRKLIGCLIEFPPSLKDLMSNLDSGSTGSDAPMPDTPVQSSSDSPSGGNPVPANAPTNSIPSLEDLLSKFR